MSTRKPWISTLAVLCLLILNPGLAAAQDEESALPGDSEVQTTDVPAVDLPAEEEPAIPATEEHEAVQNEEEQPALTPKAAVKSMAASGPSGSGSITGGIGTSSGSYLALPTPDNSEFTGAVTYRIPVIVPPGRNGLAPSIALTYNSMRGNSWIAVGWDLDLGAIRRSTKRGVYYDTNDFVFSSEGKSYDLVDRTSLWGANFYGAKAEEDFTKYYLDSGTKGWIAIVKDGTKYFYGSSPASRQSRDNQDTNIFQWCLDRIEDTNGNYMEIAYTRDQDQLYPFEIKYTGHVSPDLPPTNSIKFILEDRTDISVSYVTMSKVVTAKRLKNIEVYAGIEFVRKYVIENGYSPITKRTLLKSVTEYGSDNTTTLPSIKFTYQEGPALGTFQLQSSQTIIFPFCEDSNVIKGDLSACDVNGDSLADLYFSGYYEKKPDICGESGDNGTIHCNPQQPVSCPAFYETGLGDGNFNNHTEIGLMRAPDGWEISPFNQEEVSSSLIASYRKTVGDLDGDGNQEVITVIPGPTHHPFDYSDTYNTRINGHDYNFTYYDQPVSTCDINGDGYADLFFEKDHKIKTSPCETGPNCNGGVKTDYEYWPSAFFLIGNGDGTFKPNPIGLGDVPCCESAVPNGLGCSSSWHAQYWNPKKCNRTLGDFNGDGRTDILFASSYSNDNTRIVVLFGKGNGAFEEGSNSVNGIFYEPVSTMDLNNDGLSDIVIGSNVYLGKGDGTFSTSGIGLGDIQPVSSFPTAFGDFNGDGRLDAVSFWNLHEKRFYIGHPGPYPDLLAKVENTMGGSASLTYQPSTAFTNHNLPYAMQVVQSITTDDGLSALNDGFPHITATQYTYSGGLFDHTEREFNGFEFATQINPDGTQEISQFHQDYYLKGKPKLTQLFAPAAAGGALLSQSTMTWDTAVLASGVTFVKLSQKRTESYDDKTVFNQETYTYDEVGNLTDTIQSGTENDSLPDSVLTVKIHNEYQNLDAGGWLWRQTLENLKNSSDVKKRETTYQYDTAGNLRFIAKWLDDGNPSPVIEYQYDPSYGNRIREIDAKSNPVIIDYDLATQTYPLKITNALGHIIEYEVDYRYGYAKKKIDRSNNDNTIEYAYDPFGRLILTQNPDNGGTGILYSDASDVNAFPRYVFTEVKEANDSYIPSYAFVDGFGRSIQAVTLGEDNKYIVSRTHYDEMGRVSRAEGPFFASNLAFPQTAPVAGHPWVQTTYDYRGRPVKTQSPHGDYPGEAITATYHYSGYTTTVTDQDQCHKTEKKDFLGRIIQVTEYVMDKGRLNDLDTLYEYNAAGDLVKVIDSKNNITSLVYDSLGRKREMTDPDMGHWTYEYDPNGNLIEQVDAKSQVIKFEYDALNRVLNKNYYDIFDQPLANNSGVTNTYDNTTPNANGIGKPYTSTKANVTITNNLYDSMGRSLKVTKGIEGVDYITRNEYDLSGKVIKIIYPGSEGYFIAYAYYPGTNLIHTVTDSNAIDQATYTDYAPTGKIGQITHPNGIYTFYNYDAWSTKLVGIVSTNDPENTDPAQDLQNREYTYSRAGDILKIEDNAKGVIYDYVYDQLHRLVGEQLSGTSAPVTTQVEVITLDYTGTGPVHGVKTIDLNGVSRTCDYDANGNMTTSPDFSTPANPLNRTITYDADNMPITIAHANGMTVNFVYDSTDKRSKKAVSTGKIFLYLGDHYEVENGTAIKYIFGGNLRLAQIKGSLTSYFHKDHLGSTAAVTDASGAKVEGTTYEPFGSSRTHEGTDTSAYKFTDQEADAETNLYNYDARLYDPVLGMFVTPDTIVPNMYDPQFLNRYSYCRNNPMIYVDPSGHMVDHGGQGGFQRELTEDDQERARLTNFTERQTVINKEKALKEAKMLARANRNVLPWGVFQKAPDLFVLIVETDPKAQYGSTAIVFENGVVKGSFICSTRSDIDPDNGNEVTIIEGGYHCTSGYKTSGKRPDHFGYIIAERDYVPTIKGNLVHGGIKVANGEWMHVGNALTVTNTGKTGSRGCITIPAVIEKIGYNPNDSSTWNYYNNVMNNLLGRRSSFDAFVIRDHREDGLH